MKINVGSTNEVKVSAVREALADYPQFAAVEVIALNTPLEVSAQPITLAETVEGACSRARNAFRDCRYSFGIEDGLIAVPRTATGYMNCCVCAIYDGNDYKLGLSPAFELPVAVAQLIFEQGLDMSEAFYRAGLTENQRLGSAEGAVGLLTAGRLQRKEYTRLAISMALIHVQYQLQA